MKYLIWLSNNCTNVKEIVSSLQRKDAEVEVLLLQDGVYLADKGCGESRELAELGVRIYALRNHVEERGIASRIAVNVDLVDYPAVVDLLMEECDRIISQ